MKKLVFIFLIFAINLFAEDIYLKNGTVYFNAKIIDKNDKFITITINEGRANIALSDIVQIINTPYDPAKPSYVNLGKPQYEETNKTIISQKHFLVVAALAGFLAWDYFQSASDIQSTIDQYKKIELNTDDLESQKTRKTVLGVVSAVGCIAALYFSFKEVEIKANPNKVTVSYNF